MPQAPQPRPRDDEHARSTPTHKERLADVVARIREDARQTPGRYLKSTEVPGGGE